MNPPKEFFVVMTNVAFIDFWVLLFGLTLIWRIYLVPISRFGARFGFTLIEALGILFGDLELLLWQISSFPLSISDLSLKGAWPIFKMASFGFYRWGFKCAMLFPTAFPWPWGLYELKETEQWVCPVSHSHGQAVNFERGSATASVTHSHGCGCLSFFHDLRSLKMLENSPPLLVTSTKLCQIMLSSFLFFIQALKHEWITKEMKWAAKSCNSS